MKTLKFIYLLPLLLAVFTSCEKTEFEDLNINTLEGVDWELYSGRVYVENLKS